MKDTRHVTKKLTLILSIICHLSIDIRIEVHFLLHWEMKGHWLRVNIGKRFTRFTRDQCPFISECKQKNVLQSLNKVLLSCLITNI